MSRFAAVIAVAAVLLLATAATALPAPLAAASSGPNGVVAWMTQRVDHFNVLDTRTFQQKYIYNDTFWTPGKGPVFLSLSGEAPLSTLPNNQLMNYAADYGALVVSLEHRFFGDSQPLPTLATANLVYHSTKQALEDAAEFIAFLPTTALFAAADEAPQWITFGCSYSGALTSWLRLKYPHLTRGSFASSGVVMPILEYYQFDEAVNEAVGPSCAGLIRAGTQQIETALAGGAASNAAVKALFGAAGFSDLDFLFLTADLQAESVQYGFQENLCSALSSAASGATALVSALADYANSFYYPLYGGPQTYNTTYLAQQQQSSNAARSWLWLTCTELGFFQTAPASPQSLRSAQLTLAYFEQQCQTVFGVPGLVPAVNVTNNYYGGANISTFNLLSAASSQDPWRTACLQRSPNLLEPVVIVNCANCGHCSDLRGCPSLPGYFDLDGCESAAPKFARDITAKLIGDWLYGPL